MIDLSKNSSMFRSTAYLMVVCSTAAMLSGCAREISSNVYSERHVGEASRTFRGIVVSVREVEVTNAEKLQENGTGIATGALAGGVVGHQFGAGGGNVAATAAGAILGAVAGAYAEKSLSSQNAFEYIVELSNGEMRTVVQGKDTQYAPGQRILLIVGQSGRSRIIPDNTPAPQYAPVAHYPQPAPHYNAAPQHRNVAPQSPQGGYSNEPVRPNPNLIHGY
ncbi:MAG: glycine zipper 2TM domain-containing protein [Candidatus Paracaedimonas acanthamoebae]|uniref:17 kDa surface antigen n=1 Tax=Candidatus Paracaedimonas acanthamoebae TaxID=244581 RepID=A0A8J7PI16_9PROT|nr:glycine zipper 2TM domain-containing protein [Candidatus Paracaedimonas acanthamoebae]